ncbi:MAG: class I SAM-dependent methyltransferase [Oligoflexia bacterium]|nr:class I SAM-dependent methyltransferase [Oligoflexia bacterium]
MMFKYKISSISRKKNVFYLVILTFVTISIISYHSFYTNYANASIIASTNSSSFHSNKNNSYESIFGQGGAASSRNAINKIAISAPYTEAADSNVSVTANSLAQSKKPISAVRFSELTGIKSKEELVQESWNKKYNKNAYIFGKEPAEFLKENYQYLPASGKVLDVGMGEGRNSVFLAQKGLDVVGIDISPVALARAKKLANERGVKIKTVVASLRDYSIKEAEFDVIICFYYVDRELIKKMIKWLRPNGILIFETFTINQLKQKNFNLSNYNSDDFLNPQELLQLFPNMTILKYEEPLHKKEYRTSIILKKITKHIELLNKISIDRLYNESKNL